MPSRGPKARASSLEDAPPEGARLLFCPEARGLNPASLSPDHPAEVALAPDETHHALRVLRLQAGYTVRLFDGAGRFYEGSLQVQSQGRGKRSDAAATVTVHAAEDSATEARTALTLLAASIKAPAADLLVRQAVELGVARVWFFHADRSVVAPLDGDRARNHVERWRRLVIAASKQCGRARLMDVEVFSRLDEALVRLEPESRRVVFREDLASAAGGGNAGPPPPEAARPLAGAPLCTAAPVGAAIGPEGGFTRGEIALLDAAGFAPMAFGPRILRAETAALAAAVILLRAAGDLG